MQIQPTPSPNPNAVKFTLDRPATTGGTETFKEGSDPAASALGARIFAIGDVTNVFATGNFVSVTKTNAVGWDVLGQKVMEAITAHFEDAV